jgi:hypothetical protein
MFRQQAHTPPQATFSVLPPPNSSLGFNFCPNFSDYGYKSLLRKLLTK